METKHLLMVSVTLMILLLGCAGTTQQPVAQQQPVQNAPAINARTGANVENAAPQAQTQASAQKQYTCSLTLNPSTIAPGRSTEIGFAVQSEQNVKFTYNCGSETLGISSGGLTSGFRLCQFNTPGSVDVWIKADGVVCAQKTLIVQQQEAKTCYINASSVKRDLSSHYYAARVQFTGFSPQDELVWVCDRTTTRQTLGGSISPIGMPLYSDIYCDFTGQPEKDTIEVSIGTFSCGSISTR